MKTVLFQQKVEDLETTYSSEIYSKLEPVLLANKTIIKASIMGSFFCILTGRHIYLINGIFFT